MNRISTFRPKALSSALLISASTLALTSAPAEAANVLFSSNRVSEVQTGTRTSTGSGVLQVRLDSGATLSFVEGAEFTLNDDGSVTLHKGSVTVAGAGDAETLVIMPEGVEGRVGGTGNAANFTVAEDGQSSGHALTGNVNITRGRMDRDYGEGMMWASSGRSGIRRVMSRPGQQTPDVEREPEVMDMAEGGPAAAAENGLPVSLGDALAAAGASSDVVSLARRVDAANGNPALEAYPAGDLAALVALAANLEGAYGGQPFPAAQADIIRSYLGYLANGGSGAEFLTAYAGFLTQYLDLVRAGGLPSQFGGASQADINAFLAYQARLGALGNLGAQDEVLAQAYLDFIAGGGNPDLFASQFTSLVEAYFAFVRGGGNPSDFSGASQELVDAYVAFLANSGLAGQLSTENQEILAAYLESGGFAFAETYAAALADYFTYLQNGGLPSASGDLTPEQLQAYLELLEGSGLFAQLLGAQSQFYADYLAFLQGGGDPDDFGQLNANIFAGYASQLNAYYAYLLGGGVPSQFQGDPSELNAYLAALANAGALDAFLGANAGFFADYFAFLQGGGDIDAWSGLNANIFAGYADALNAYYSYLAQGGLPSEYTVLTQQQIAAYVAALQAQGASSAFLAALAGFYGDYLAYLQGGGDPDVYLGLPALNTQLFADTLDLFGQFLLGGGLPSNFSGADLETLALYIDALDRAGQLGLIGSDRDLLAAFFAYFGSGANVDQFVGLPVYANYAAALSAYYDFLLAGGLPAAYGALTPQQVADYLAALSAAGGFAAQLGNLSDFYTAYFAHIAGGNDPATFSGLPVYADYVTALNAYFTFLANGGLPADYTALPLSTIEAYLDALNAAGGFAAYGNLNAFFSAYYAFVAGGGDPADFAGLPVYADYLAAIADFYAFIFSGGLPSGYTALTQEQIEAYLAALSGAGLLGSTFSGDQLDFFNAYLAYLNGGGIPDDFGGLPQPAFAGVFGSYLAPDTASTGSVDATVEADGTITALTFPNGYTPAPSAQAVKDDFGRFGDVVAWTSYQEPDGFYTNRVEQYLAGERATNLPASGTVNYLLVGGTAPADVFAASGERGYFEGALAVAFGATPKVGVEFDVFAGSRGWHAQTTGGAANPANGGMTLDTNLMFFTGRLDTTGIAGDACNSTCETVLSGGAFGDGASYLGFTYFVNELNATDQSTVLGTAVFGQSGTELPGLGTAPVQPDVTLPGQSIAFANPMIGDDVHTLSNVTYNADGIPVGYEARLDANEALTSGNMVLADTGTAGNGALSWVRWSDGAPGGNWYNQPLLPVGANGGYHVIAGAPLSNMPASGAVEYDLIGFTTPTRHDESTSTGSVAGGAAVVFGASPVVALDLDITSGADVFNLFTAGKLTDPTQSTFAINPFDGMFHTLGFADGFAGSQNAVFVESAASFCASTCTGFVEGFLAGEGASHMGLAYSIRGNTIPNKFIDGTAAFAAGATIDLGGGTSAGTGTPLILDQADLFGPDVSTIGYAAIFADELDPEQLSSEDASATFNANGVVTNIDSPFVKLDIGTATATDVSGNALHLIGRWTDGTVDSNFFNEVPYSTSQGAHYFVGAPITANFAYPTSGRVDYELLAATAPTVVDGTQAPGKFEAGMSLLFDPTSITLGFEGLITIPDPAGDFTFAIETPGGLADPSQSIFDLITFDDAGRFSIIIGSGYITSSDGVCSVVNAQCKFHAEGAFAGDDVGQLAFAYNAHHPGRDYGQSISGAAIFGATTPIPGGSTGGGSSSGGQYTSNFTGTRDAIVYKTYTLGSLASGFGGSADLVNGELVNFTSILGTVSKGSASVVEAGDVGDLAWGRWVNGTVETRTIVGNADTVVAGNGGYHVMAGTSPTSLPTSGTVNYNLIATTSPTDNLGSAPGTLTGELAIAFGSINLVGYDFNMEIGGRGYSVSTNGGAANPGASATNLVFSSGTVIFTGNHNSVLPGSVTGTGGACQFSCQVTIGGTMYGANAGYAGVAMNVFDGGNGVQASGLAIFEAGTTAVTTNPYASAPQTTQGVAPTVAMAPPDWDRWEVGSDNIGNGNGMAVMAPGLEAVTASGIQYSPEQIARLEAFYASRGTAN